MKCLNLVGIIAELDKAGVEDLEIVNGLIDDGSGVVRRVSFEDFGSDGDEERNLKGSRVSEGAVEEAVEFSILEAGFVIGEDVGFRGGDGFIYVDRINIELGEEVCEVLIGDGERTFESTRGSAEVG